MTGLDESYRVRFDIKYTIMCLSRCIGGCRQVSESLVGPLGGCRRVLTGLGRSRPVSAGLGGSRRVSVSLGGSHFVLLGLGGF